MKRFLAIFYLCLAALSSAAAANPVVVNVVTSTWEGYANPDGTGYYFDILQRVFPASQWQLNVLLLEHSILSSTSVPIWLSVFIRAILNIVC